MLEARWEAYGFHNITNKVKPDNGFVNRIKATKFHDAKQFAIAFFDIFIAFASAAYRQEIGQLWRRSKKVQFGQFHGANHNPTSDSKVGIVYRRRRRNH